MRLIYRPLATLAMIICLVANLAMIFILGWIEVDLALMPGNEVRNLGLVVMGLCWGYAVWNLVEFIPEIPKSLLDIWR
jgi:hypothetical protein